jgi:IclR family acetate operon transcriptional repressor
MDQRSSGTAAIDRTLALFEALVRDDGERPLSAIAAELGLPPSTAYRMAALLVRRGLIAPSRRGHYRAGLTLIGLGTRSTPNRIIAEAARPLLRQLARALGATAHLGVWDGDMVTYLVKESGGRAELFTREGGQLEAYCSAIGKILLAGLDAERRQAYLAAGPFIALTERTVTDPDYIGAALEQVSASGFALDEEEIADGLFCIALPIRDGEGRTVAAISLSRSDGRAGFAEPPEALSRCAAAITARIGGAVQDARHGEALP